MIHTKTILVPVDFSGASLKAVNYGLSLALQFGARLVLVHVASGSGPHDLETRLLDLVPQVCRDALNVEVVVESGEVRQRLMEIIVDRNADPVVMGTHGRTYFERLILGSVTERMLRKLPVPVLTVAHLDPEKEIHGPAATVPLGRILYATDLSEGSEAGLRFSLRFAMGLDARLTIAHVVRPMETFRDLEFNALLPEEVLAGVQEHLNRIVALEADGKVPTTTVVAEGTPYDTINQLADKLDADLIIINLQSRGRLDRALIGSTAERVIRTSTVPVLSLPLPATYAARWEAA